MPLKSPRSVNPKKRRIILYTALALLVITLGLIVYLFLANASESNRETTKQRSNQTTTTPDEVADSDESNVTPGRDGDEITNNPPSQPSSPPNSGSISITRAEQVGDTVVVSAIVSGVNSGNCSATFTQGTKQVSESAAIQQGPSYYGCQIEVPRNQFSSAGTWSVAITASNSSARASGSGELKL